MGIRKLVIQADEKNENNCLIFGKNCMEMPYIRGDHLKDLYFKEQYECDQLEIKFPCDKLVLDEWDKMLQHLPKKLDQLQIWNHHHAFTIWNSPYYDSLTYIIDSINTTHIEFCDCVYPDYVYNENDKDRIFYILEKYKHTHEHLYYLRLNYSWQ